MMKLFSAEKTGLKTGYVKFLLVSFLLISLEFTFPQTPFKGFGKLNKVAVDSGFTKIFSFDFNKDEYSDLMLFNPLKKEIQILKGKTGTEFTAAGKSFSPLEISNIEPVIDIDNQIENYAVVSRRQRSFSLIKFNSSGSISVKDKLVFDTYPENLSVSLNLIENNHEYLISGNSFRGLSIIKKVKNKFEASQLFTNNVFQNARFIDLNSDGADDIAAVDVINNQLHFIFRNLKGDFEDLRQLSFNDQIVSLYVFDINYDQYKDIIITGSSSIEILYGDSFSSFKKSIKINTLYQPDKIAIGDFNRDGFFDFTYLNKESGITSTIFANDFNNFYPELIHFKNTSSMDLIPYFSKFIYGTATLGGNGEISILSKVNAMSDSQTLALGIMPDKLMAFDFMDNGIIDIAFTDNYNSHLNIILRDASGLPEKLFAINLYNTYENVLVFNQSKTTKLFLFYNKDSRQIETIEADCKNYLFNRRFIYADGLINDVAIKPDLKKEAAIYVLYTRNEQLYFQQYFKSAEKYETRISRSLADNFSDAFFVNLTYPTIAYFKNKNDNSVLSTVEIKREKLKHAEHYQFKKDFKSLNTISSVNTSLDNRSFYSLADYENRQIIFTNNTLTDEIFQFTQPEVLRITDKNHLFFGKSNSLFVYEKEKRKLSRLSFSNAGRVLEISEKLTDIHIDNFLIVNFDQRNEHIVFTNSNNGTIEIKALPQ